MVKQITVDENGVVVCASIGGYIPGGIDVEEIPQEVMRCPGKWTYKDGEFSENPDYVPPEEEQSFEELQEEINLDTDYRLTCLELGI